MADVKVPNLLYMYGLFMIGAIAMMGFSLGTSHWIETYYDSDYTGHSGLFVGCNLEKCVSITHPSAWVKAVRGLCLTAIILYGITLLIIGHLVVVCKLKVDSKAHGWLTVSISWIASAFAAIGAIHFYTMSDPGYLSDDSLDYGYSFYLSFVSGFLGFVAGIFSVPGVFSLYRTQHPQLPVQAFVCPPPTTHVSFISPPMQQYPGHHPHGYSNPGFVPVQHPMPVAYGQGQIPPPTYKL